MPAAKPKPKPKSPRRKTATAGAAADSSDHSSNGRDLSAVYRGINHGHGFCQIGKCQHSIAAANLASARALMQEHREQAHAR